jgi:transposase
LVAVRVEDHATVLRMLARRHSQIAWGRNKAVCRVHALVSELVAGGIGKELVVSQASGLLEQIEPSDAVGRERYRLALELVDDIARYDTQRKASEARIRAAVAASGTTLTEVFGIGDVVAATLIGHTGDVRRFPTAEKFASYNGTAPVERSSGNPKQPVHRLSRRGNRTMNHALHIAAVTQIRYAHSPGRKFYDRKRDQGHSGKSALRALKRRISDVAYRHLVADVRRAVKQ